jgi:excisionase family DNA binding protein
MALPQNDGACPALDTVGLAPLPPVLSAEGVPETRLLTARIVAARLDVCAETVLRWIRNGELPAIRLPGGAVRIAEAELNGWLLLRATPRRGVLATKLDAADGGRYPSEYDACR